VCIWGKCFLHISNIKFAWRSKNNRPVSASVTCPSNKASRKKTIIKVIAEDSSGSNVKRANLSAAKSERIKLPDYNDGVGGKKYHISEFLRQPSGIAAVLNMRALQTFESLDANTY
ncbi:hypothetical protein S83_066923, partial [Arachis hypogaea]